MRAKFRTKISWIVCPFNEQHPNVIVQDFKFDLRVIWIWSSTPTIKNSADLEKVFKIESFSQTSKLEPINLWSENMESNLSIRSVSDIDILKLYIGRLLMTLIGQTMLLYAIWINSADTDAKIWVGFVSMKWKISKKIEFRFREFLVFGIKELFYCVSFCVIND